MLQEAPQPNFGQTAEDQMRPTSTARMRRSLIALGLAVTLASRLGVAANSNMTFESLTSFDRKLVDNACTREKYSLGPAAYRACVEGQVRTFSESDGPVDLTSTNPSDRKMLDYACTREKYSSGPTAYYRCVREQLRVLQSAAPAPDLSTFSQGDQKMMDNACTREKYSGGPAAYRRCIERQADALARSSGPANLDGVAPEDRKMIDNACTREKYSVGPAAYHDCVRTQLRALTGSLTPPPERATPAPKPPLPTAKLATRAPVQVKQEDASPPPIVFKKNEPANPPPTFQWKKPEQPAPVVVPPNQPPRRSDSKSDDTLFWLIGGVVALYVGSKTIQSFKKINCTSCGNVTKNPTAMCDGCGERRRGDEAKHQEQRRQEQARQTAEEQRSREAARARADQERRRREAEERERINTLADLQKMTGTQFEAFVCRLFEADGYRVRHNGASGDQGIDIVIEMDGSKDVVQCKRWRNDVGSPVLRDFYGSLMHAGARYGFIVTTASFTADAKSFAEGKPFSLIDGDALLAWIKGKRTSRPNGHRPPPAGPPPGEARFDPFAVLGVNRGASKDEVKKAYREKMAQYHPDKVAHLGPELQELARRKALEINQAYEKLG